MDKELEDTLKRMYWDVHNARFAEDTPGPDNFYNGNLKAKSIIRRHLKTLGIEVV